MSVTRDSRRYDLLLSFAAEDQKLVGQLADALARAKLRILRDELDEKPSGSVRDLSRHLARYRPKARHALVFVSKHYAGKGWSGNTLKLTLAELRKLSESLAWVFPIHLDKTELPELFSDGSPVRLNRRNLHVIAKLILENIKGRTYAPFEVDSLLWDGQYVIYNGARMVSYWPRHLKEAQKSKCIAVVKPLDRVKYGDEEEDWGAAKQPCHDCRAKKGQYHVPGCDVERCPSCGGQLISCACHVGGWDHLRFTWTKSGKPGKRRSEESSC